MAAPDRKRLQELARQWLRGELDASQREEFERWLNKVHDEPIELEHTAGNDAEYEAMLFHKIQRQIGAGKRRVLWPRIAAAASIVLALSIGGYFLLHKPASQQTAQNLKQDVQPGHNQATLTLADGRKIILTKGLKGTLATQGEVVISAD